MLVIQLEKEDLVRLVMGSDPDFDDIGKFQKQGFGHHHGGFNDRWDWDEDALMELEEETLVDLYSMMRGKLYYYAKVDEKEN